MQDKIQTMLNFAIRAKKTVYGVDNIVVSKKAKVVVVCKTLSQRSLKRLLCEATRIPILRTVTYELEYLAHKSGKAIAVTDSNMAKEILKNINNDYELISEGK